MRFLLAMVVCGLAGSAATTSDNGAPSISPAGMVNAATGETVLAPYSICSLYGTNLFLGGVAFATGGVEIPETLAGVTVLIGFTPVGLVYVSASQINLLIPNSLSPGNYFVRVSRDGMSSAWAPIVISGVAPGLFAGVPGTAVVTHADGTPVNETAPAVPGEVVIFYGTGLGRLQPDPTDRFPAPAAAPIMQLASFQVLLDGVPLDPSLVQYAGAAPSFAGLYQVNVQLPGNLSPNNPQVQISVAGSISPLGLSLITSGHPGNVEARQ